MSEPPDTGSPVRIVVADDHTIVRQGLRSLLEGQPDFDVVGEAGEGNEALRLVRALRPDVLVLDLAMPGLHGLDVCRRTTTEVPGCRVVVLSMHAEAEMVRQAEAAGASAFLVKGAGIGELVAAVRLVREGGRRFPDPAAPPPGEPLLTAREVEVLRLVAEGYTTRQIALILGVAPKTADAHRQNLMAKLDIHDVAGLVRYAFRRGLVGA